MEDATQITQLTKGVGEITITEDSIAISQDDAILASSEIYVNNSVTQTGNGSDNNPYASISEAITSASSGDTIYIASGIYSGSENVALTIDKELTIKSLNENNVIIDGESNSWIFYVTSSNVVIDGLTFVHAKSSWGSAIYYESGSTNNIINNSKFINNSAGQGAGALYFDDDEGSVISNTLFENNSASYNGGAIYYYQNVENSIFDNVTFINNSAGNNGGAIYYYWGTYDSNYTCVSFKGNKVSNYYGGAILFNVVNNIYFIDSNFTDNYAASGGGAVIYWSDSDDVNFINAVFENNTASSWGGAILYWSGSYNDNFINASFKKNNAGQGSAIYVGYCENLNLTSSSFIENKAKSNLVISVDKFNNVISASLEGGNNIVNAIYSSSMDNFIFSNVTYWNGSIVNSDEVEPIYSSLEANQNITCEIYDSTTDELIYNETNVTDENGSAIFDYSNMSSQNILKYRVYHSEDSYYTSIESTDEFNPVMGDFELLQYLVDNASENDVINLTRNLTYTIGLDTITDGVRITKNNLTINGNGYIIDALGQSRIFYVSANTFNIDNVTLINGYHASCGGAIYLVDDLSNSIFDGVVLQNNSAKNGGAIYFAKNTINNTFTNSEFFDSKATVGGAINVAGDFNANMLENITFENNNANAIYLRGSSNNAFVNLTAGNYTINVTAIVGNNYNGSFNSSQIIVNKANATLIINSSGDINPSVDEVIVISVPDDVDGDLLYYVNCNLSDIVENNTIVLSDLTEGNYTVLVTLVNDTNYNDCSNFTVFVVAKVNSTVGVSVDDIVVGDNATVFITLPGDATGNVTFSLNNESIVIEIANSTVFGLNGILSMPLVLDALSVGNYSVVVTYNGNSKYYPSNSSANFTVSKISDYNITYEYNDRIIEVTVPENATGNITVKIGNGTYVSPIENGTALLNVSDLSYGDYNITIIYSGDDIYESASLDGNISILVPIVLEAPDVVKYYGGSERFYAYLYDMSGNPLANETVIISINNVSYTRFTNENGSASIAINLNPGNYSVDVTYGDLTINSTVTVNSTVIGNDLVKVFRNDTQYWATFLDSQGNNLPNGTDVTFNINGVFYIRQINENGSAKLNINLNQGEYIITAFNPVTGQNYSNNIKVIPRITENSDLVKYYRNDSQYVVRLIGDDGNPVGAGEIVTFNINGVFYNRTTNESGYAKLNINLYSGDYIITAEYI